MRLPSIATIKFQHADRNSSRHSVAKPDGGTIGDIMVFGQDQWAWGAHLRRAQRARRVRLRRKQPNQSNPTTWRLAAMNMAKSLHRQSETATGGLPRHSATTPDLAPNGSMLNNPALAKVLDTSEFDDMRTGLRLALFNERGVHGFTHGSEELEIANRYRDYATKYDAAKFTLIAATLRSLAESYERDAERESKRNPFQYD